MRARVALRFDLQTIPATATVKTARLIFTKTWSEWGATATISVHRIARSGVDWKAANWNSYASGKSWSSAGGDYVSPAGAVASVPGSGTTSIHDITNIVKGRLAAPATNTGMLLVIQGGQSGQTYVSTEAADATKRPRLEITYGAPATGVMTAQPARRVTSRALTATSGYDIRGRAVRAGDNHQGHVSALLLAR